MIKITLELDLDINGNSPTHWDLFVAPSNKFLTVADLKIYFIFIFQNLAPRGAKNSKDLKIYFHRYTEAFAF